MGEIINNELLKVEVNENQEQVISGRVLYEFLGIRTQYTKWFDRMCNYGFVENEDYLLVSQKSLTNNSKNPYTEITDHILKMDMAKEISMIQRNEKGKQARQYFIQIEKEFHKSSLPISNVLLLADKRISELEKKVKHYELGYSIIKNIVS